MNTEVISLICDTHRLANTIRDNLIKLGYAAKRHGKSIEVICYNLAQFQQDLADLKVNYKELPQ